ncbi:MAG TPA: hypothetical protein VM818_13940 [Vicinamibacterales bacterium]|jgi:hypothetical protein|nr:hypothetical protein [Vicinamibacterales bacterium]
MKVAPMVLWFSLLSASTAWSQAPLPANWPARVELGMADGPGGAAAMKRTAPFAFRYQYLAGGANTGSGWATWNSNGDFVRFYVEDSVTNGITPVFTYYMLLQSASGGGSESQAVFTNLNNTSTMTAYFNDLKLFFQKAGAFSSQRVVLHVEPDLWGYMEQRSTNDDATTVPVKVAETGIPQLAGLPGNMSGFARAVLALRNAYAPNVTLGYHISVWGTGIDIALSNPSDATVDTLGTRAASFYTSLAANFDIAFAEFSDRDSGFYQHVYGDGGRSWWDAEDFRRNTRFLARFSAAAGKRIVMWQIPLGNTKMRAQNNTTGHYQDNRPEWLLDDPGRAHLTAYRDAGVVAFLFGGGAGGTTCACNAQNDGVTNPSPINGNVLASEQAPAGSAPVQVMRGTTPTLVTPYAADDDGGFFRWKAWQYYQQGAMPIASGNEVPSAPTNLRIVP